MELYLLLQLNHLLPLNEDLVPAVLVGVSHQRVPVVRLKLRERGTQSTGVQMYSSNSNMCLWEICSQLLFCEVVIRKDL